MNFLPWYLFKIPKLSLNTKSDHKSNLWNFLRWGHPGHQFLLCKYFKNLWEFIEIRKNVYKKIIWRFHQAVFKRIHRSQILSNIVFTDSLESCIPGPKVIIFVFLVSGFFMVKLSFDISNCSVKQQNCRAKCKLPCKSPGPTIRGASSLPEKVASQLKKKKTIKIILKKCII